MRLTTARYYTPSGRSIQAEGIEPDITVAAARIRPPPEKDAAKAGSDPSKPAAAGGAEDEAPVDQSLMGSSSDYQLARAVDLLRGVSLSDRHTAIEVSAGRQ
jgi:carboxyl-terminal processing protease